MGRAGWHYGEAADKMPSHHAVVPLSSREDPLPFSLLAGRRKHVVFPICFSERWHKWETINDLGTLSSARLDQDHLAPRLAGLHQCRCIKHLLFGKSTFNYRPSLRLACSACKITLHPLGAYSALYLLQQSFSDPGQRGFLKFIWAQSWTVELQGRKAEMLTLDPKRRFLPACPYIAKRKRNKRWNHLSHHWVREKREGTGNNWAHQRPPHWVLTKKMRPKKALASGEGFGVYR